MWRKIGTTASRVFAYAIFAATTFALYGCGGFPRNEPGDGFGQITVSSPRVEGRERLINDRREQELWLSDQLVKLEKADFGVSADVDLRSLALTAAQVAINVDPAIKLDEVNRTRQLEVLRQAADDERVLGTFRAAQRDQILADAKLGKITNDEAIEKLKKLGLDPTSTKPSTAASASGSTAPGVPVQLTSRVSANADSNKTTPPDTLPRRSTIASTPIEAFQDLLAAREVIRNERNDVRLDALHDLAGHTLYRLTLNAEVLPQADSSAWAVARLRVKLPEITAESIQPVLALAREQFEKNLVEDSRNIHRLLLQRLNEICWKQEAIAFSLSREEWKSSEHQRAFRRAIRCASSEIGSRTRQILEDLLARAELSDVGLLSGDAEPAWTPEQKARVQFQDLLLVRQEPTEGRSDFDIRRRQLSRWSVWLGELIGAYEKMQRENSVLHCLGPTELAVLRKKSMCAGVIEGSAEQRLASLMKNAVMASVYAVTPKETVQRLSEVASNRKITEFLLGLSAVTGSTGVAAGVQSIRANDAFYSALRRQPLVVGITEVGNACSKDSCGKELIFGWVLGPSFEISNDGKGSRFRHTVVQRSVSAELVLPAWLDHVVVERETFWIRENGASVSASPCRTVDEQNKCQVKPMVVMLPGRPVEALAAADARRQREPRVEKYQYLDVVEDEEASVYIKGQNVWRSTEVLIGSQRAKLVTVLPDNAGVLASFGPIRSPHGADTPNRGQAILTLVTSDGRVDAGRVSITSRGVGEFRPLTFSGVLPRVIAGIEHSLELSQPLKATESVTIRIGSKKDVNLRVLLEKTTQLSDDRKRIVFVLPPSSVPNLKSGDSLLVDGLVTRASGGVEVFSVVKSGIYYEKESDVASVVVASRSRMTDPIALKVVLPKGSVDGFTSFALGAAKLLVTAKIAGVAQSAAMESDCPIKATLQDSCETTLSTSAALKEVLSSTKNGDIELSVSFKGNDVPKLREDAIEVKS